MNPKLKTAAVAVACLSLAIGITYAIAQTKDRNSPPRQGDDAKAKPTCPKQNPDSNCPQGRDAKNILKCPHCGTMLAMVVVGDDDRPCRQIGRRDDDGERPMMNRPGRGGDDDRGPMMGRPGRDGDRGRQMARRDDGRDMPRMQQRGQQDRGPMMDRPGRGDDRGQQMARRDDGRDMPRMQQRGPQDRRPMMDRPGRDDNRSQQMDRRDGDDNRGPQMGRQNRMMPPMQRDQAFPEDDFPMMMDEYMPDFPSMPELPQQ